MNIMDKLSSAWTFRKPTIIKMPNVFSEQHVKQLEDELSLLSLAIAKLKDPAYYRRYMHSTEHHFVSPALTNLVVRRIEVETRLVALKEFLSS